MEPQQEPVIQPPIVTSLQPEDNRRPEFEYYVFYQPFYYSPMDQNYYVAGEPIQFKKPVMETIKEKMEPINATVKIGWDKTSTTIKSSFNKIVETIQKNTSGTQ